MRDNVYSASLSRTQGRNTWAIIFRHPKRECPEFCSKFCVSLQKPNIPEGLPR